MARIKEVMKVYTDFRDELKAFLELPTGAGPEDTQFVLWYGFAVAYADTYVDRNFQELADASEIPGQGTGADIVWITDPFHSGIKVFVFSFVGVSAEVFSAATKRPFGLTSARTRDLSKSYAIGSRIEGGEVTADKIAGAMRSWLKPSKLFFT